MSPRNAVVEPTVIEDWILEEAPHGDRRRVIGVPAEQRVFPVAEEHRVLSVPAELRVFPVDREVF